MKFNEAMEALKAGSRVTRKPWAGSMYFQIEGNDIKSYQPIIKMYAYDETIMISEDWKVEGEEGTFAFYDIIRFLQQGKKAKLSEWKEMYIYYDTQTKQLLVHQMDIFRYHPDFESFMADDWMIIA